MNPPHAAGGITGKAPQISQFADETDAFQ